MSKSIKELADEIGVTKSGIRKLLTPDFRTKYAFYSGNSLLVKDAGVLLIYKHFKKDKTQTDIANKPQTIEKSLYASYQKQNAFLLEQIAFKDKQIEMLQKLLNQQNQLLIDQQNEQKQLVSDTANSKKHWWHFW